MLSSIRRSRRRRGLAVLSSLAMWLAATPVARAAYTFDSSEAAFDAAYAQSTISLTGRVIGPTGQPIAGATVTVIGFGQGSANSGKTGTTDAAGGFTIDGLTRRSALLKVARDGFYGEIVAVDLQRPQAEASTAAGDIALTPAQAGRVRLMFVGDTMFGRRFTDEDEDGIEGEAGDLIRPGSRSADAKAVVAYVRDALSSADLTIANLECAVTSNPATPHPYKSYTFFSYPETLDGLVHAGIDAVSLGNNHVFDYLGEGVEDTINALAEHEVEFVGGEMNETLAAGAVLRPDDNGVPLALQGFSTLRSDGTTLSQYLLVARDPSKAGALEATSANMTEFLEGEVGDRFAVPMIHGGTEWSSYPSDKMRGIFVDLIEQGAGMVVAHHTHTAQGIGLYDAGDGPRFVLISLGNFIFDQSTFEAWQSMIAVADVDLLSGGAFDVARLQLIPVHVERYVPKLLTGAWRDRLGRQIGHLSGTLPTTPSGSSTPDGLKGATVFPAGQRTLALRSSAQYATATTTQSLSQTVTSGVTGAIDYVRSGPADVLARVQSSATAQLEVGREVLLYGDFEDLDVDDRFHEGSAWSTGSAYYLENSVVRRGIGAGVLLRKSTDGSSVSLANFRTIPVRGGARMTVRGWVKGDKAGTFRVTTTTYTASGSTISTVERFVKSSGTYEWTRFSVDFTLPSNAVDFRINLRQSAPSSGEGRAFVDDVEVIQWETRSGDVKAGVDLPTPNDYGFVRLRGISGGTIGVTLTHRSYTAK